MQAYAQLDADLARDVAPVVPLRTPASRRSCRSGSAASCSGPRSICGRLPRSSSSGRLDRDPDGPSPKAIPDGALPTSIVFTTFRCRGVDARDGSVAGVCDPDGACADCESDRAVTDRDRLGGRRRAALPGSMRVTVSDPVFATQIAPSPAAIAVGRRPTLIGVPIALLERRRIEALHGGAVAVDDPDEAVRRRRLPPARSRSTPVRSPRESRGSMRASVESREHRPDGLGADRDAHRSSTRALRRPTSIVFVTCPNSGSTAESCPSAPCATQTDPAPTATPVGVRLSSENVPAGA